MAPLLRVTPPPQPRLLSLYALGLSAYSANKILVPVFYALDDTRFPVVASFLSVMINIVFINLLIDHFQHRAIALSMSCSMLISFFFLGIVLYKKMCGFSLSSLFKGLVKVCLGTLCMSIFLFFSRAAFASRLTGTVLEQVVTLTGIILGAALLYFLAIYLLRLEELVMLTEKLRKKLAERTAP